MSKYSEISADRIPANIRFDVPPQNQGQIIEVAYGDNARYSSLAVLGAPLKRETDHSGGSVTYYERVAVVTFRGRAFGGVLQTLRARVGYVSGFLGVYDSVADHFTTRHSLTAVEQNRALKAAREVFAS